MDKNKNDIIGQVESQDFIITKRPSQRKSWSKAVIKMLFWTLFIYLAVVGVKALSAYTNINVKNEGTKSPFLKLPKITPDVLAGEGDGRINILLIGVGGEKHSKGGNLADTIIIASIDPNNKKIAMLSIPRDLQVTLPKPLSGIEKINAVHALGEQNSKKIPGGGPELIKKSVSTILDLPIHYFIRVDFDGLKQIVDTLGGVTVNVEKTINDPFYPAPNLVDYQPFYLKEGVQKINGDTALRYARSRQTTSDFDRAKRQQNILVAIKDKSLSLGVLSNPKKIFELISTLGKHIKTDLQALEMERLLSILKDVNSDIIISKVLDNGPDGPLISTNNGGYYLVPKTGNFKEVQTIAHSIFTDPYISQEDALIAIQNGSNETGKGSEVSNILKKYNYNISSVVTSPASSATTYIYDMTKGEKKITVGLLKRRLSATVKTSIGSEIINATPNADIIVVVGDDYVEESN